MLRRCSGLSRASLIRRSCLAQRVRYSNSEAAQQLDSLPEVQEASRLCAHGKHASALPLLQRVVEICSSTMGATSSLTQTAQLRLGSTYFALSDLRSAEVLHKVTQFADCMSSVVVTPSRQPYAFALHFTRQPSLRQASVPQSRQQRVICSL